MLNHQQYVNYRSTIVGAVPFRIEWLQGLTAAAEATRVPPQKFQIRLSEIAFDHTVFELKRPWAVNLYAVEDNTWYCADEEQRFLGCGDSMENALHSFEEDFCVYWRVIAQAPDDELAEDAHELKKFLRSIVVGITKR